MKKHNILLATLEALISKEYIDTVIKENKYIDTARKFTVPEMLKFFRPCCP